MLDLGIKIVRSSVLSILLEKFADCVALKGEAFIEVYKEQINKMVESYKKKMKRLFLLYTMCLTACVVMSQEHKFELQSDGTFSLSDKELFYVINCEGTQSELYNKVLINATKTFVSPEEVVSKVENEMISINGISEDCIDMKAMMGVHVFFSIQYNLQFQFKDGKIRVEVPTITRFFTDNNADIAPFSGWLNAQGVFKKGKPNPKKQYVIDQFNNELNGIILRLLNLSEQSNDW